MENYVDIKNKLVDSSEKYKVVKNAENRNNLQNAIRNGFEFLNEMNPFQDKSNDKFVVKLREELFPLLLESNSLLSTKSKHNIDGDFSYGDFIKDLPKSYIEYLPAKDTKKTIVKEIWNGDSIITPKDKLFWDIFGDWVGDDDLRPQMNGVYIDEFGATGTDAHKLIHLVSKNIRGEKDKPIDTIYDRYGKVIDAKYPLYRNVSNINNDIILTSIDCQLMYDACKILSSNNLVNPYTHRIDIKVKDKVVALNCDFLLINFETWLKLGIKKVDWYNNKNEYEYDKKAFLFIEKDGYSYNQDKINYTLLMPIYKRSDEPTDTFIEIIDENSLNIHIKGSPAYFLSSSGTSISNKSTKDLINDLKALLPFLDGSEKIKTRKIISDLQVLSQFD